MEIQRIKEDNKKIPKRVKQKEIAASESHHITRPNSSSCFSSHFFFRPIIVPRFSSFFRLSDGEVFVLVVCLVMQPTVQLNLNETPCGLGTEDERP